MKIDAVKVQAELCKRSFKAFILRFWQVLEPRTPLVWSWHMDCFVEHLEAIKQIRNLLINCPPGMSKSSIFSVLFNAWMWTKEPQAKFLLASHSLPLTVRDSSRTRELILSEQYQAFYNLKLSNEVNQKSHFENTKNGCRTSTAVGGGVLGWKGNYLIADDLHNSQDSESDAKCEQVCNWFSDGFYNRCNDFAKDCRIVIGQRIARNDISNFIINNYPNFTHINLPYEYVKTTFVSPIGWIDPRKEEGEPLFPERFPASEIEGLKKKVKSYNAQWQQNPIDTENALFKADNFRYFTERDEYFDTGYKDNPSDRGVKYVDFGERKIYKRNCWRLCAADLAVATHNKADYTVIMVCDIARTGEILVLHTVRERMGGTKFIPTLKSILTLYKPSYVLMEQTGLQGILIDQARAEGIMVRTFHPQRNKVERAIPMVLKMEQGQLYFAKHNSWLNNLEQELIEFPDGEHDDQVDTLSSICNEASKRIMRTWEEEDTRSPAEKKIAAEAQAKENFRKALLEGLF